MSKLEREIEKLTQTTHKDAIQTFNDFIDYCLWAFGVPAKNWTYKAGTGKAFYAVFCELIKEYQFGIACNTWCDPLGDCFMSLIKGIAKYRGQYFTPVGICRLMAELTVNLCDNGDKKLCGVFGKRTIISDPTCGSGRNLIAAKAIYAKGTEADQPYFVGEDIDELCCKMTAINLCMHGCYGEVICHDTLTEPDGLRFGYLINVSLRYNGMPSINYSEQPLMFEETTYNIRAMKQQKMALEKQKQQPKEKELSFLDSL